MSEGVEVIPSAKRLMKSLRDLGYDFVSAVADIIDNSIEAKATEISIDVDFNGDDSWVRIIDNGLGMSKQELQEAMRYGSDREYDEESLGRFGLGLKTASLSQCQYLLVASRNNPEKAYINAFCWDLSHIDKTDKWEIITISRQELDNSIREPLEKGTGTVVIWTRLDRILGYKHPYGEMARKRMLSMCGELEEHISMVFHKYLMGGVRGRKLKIYLNGNEVIPWDPFVSEEPKIKELQGTKLLCEFENDKNEIIKGSILVQPYILPRQDEFSSNDAWELASGPKKWNQQQGFYIYRAGRLIQSGGWSWLRVTDEHTKLARIAVSFSPALDEAFKINVQKMQVQFPAQIKDDIKEIIEPIVVQARNRYDRNDSKTSKNKIKKGFNSNPNNGTLETLTPQKGKTIINDGSGIFPSNVTSKQQPQEKLWTIVDIHQKLIDVAKKEERPVIERVFNRFKNKHS